MSAFSDGTYLRALDWALSKSEKMRRKLISKTREDCMNEACGCNPEKSRSQPRPVPLAMHYDMARREYVFSDGFTLDDRAVSTACSLERVCSLVPTEQHATLLLSAFNRDPVQIALEKARDRHEKRNRAILDQQFDEIMAGNYANDKLDGFTATGPRKKPRRSLKHRLRRWLYKRALWRWHRQCHVRGGKHYVGDGFYVPCAYCILEKRQ